MAPTPARTIHRLRWSSPDPAVLAERVRQAGIEARSGWFRLGPLVVRLVAGPTDRLGVDDEPASVDDEDAPVSTGWVVLAVAWATVDLERAATQIGVQQVQRRPRDATLGASVGLVTRPPVVVALVEPDTEGRLAAMLARHGEGPVGVYAVRAGSPGGVFADAGPFGSQRLLPLSPVAWAPVLIEVERPRSGGGRAATIRP